MNHDHGAPQLTARAILLSLALTVALAAANAYLGLFAGMTVATAIPAAVISMGVLRLLGRASILENNIVATGASAGSAIAAGTIFTIPALVIMGRWTSFDYWWVLAIAGLGGLLGVLFSVPLRRTLIVEQNLKFPEGVATAEVLKIGENPGPGLRALGLAALAAAAFKTALAGLRLSPEAFTAAGYLGQRTIAVFAINLSPALLGVGYIVGLNIGSLMVAGGGLSWWVFIPYYYSFLLDQDPALAARVAGAAAGDAAYMIWSAKIRYIGVGAMLIGGLWSLWTLRRSLLSGIRSGLALHDGQRGDRPHTERDLPMAAILTGILLFVLPLFALYQAVVGQFGVALAMAVIMVIAGFVFSSVSGYMAGLVGSSNNPVSGITISTILFAALVLLGLLGPGSTVGPVAAVLIGAVICNAAAIAGDNLQDLKAGQLVGATPWRQQVMLGIGALASAAVMAPVLNLLLEAYGIGTPARAGVTALPAPQATLMASVASGIFGAGLPWNMVATGAVVGALVITLDEWLKRRGQGWRTPVLAVAVGMYLPLELSTPIFAGGLLAELATRWHRRRNPGADPELQKQNGLLFAAGLIAGEALIGVALAVPIVLSGDAEVLAVAGHLRPGQWLGIVALAAVGWWLFRTATAGARRNA
ncbi:MAG: oligopeptide transporter, OPT family [Gammaproteobacteria bacterium]|nr:oligopeptide transporter, OPT family [Gammaproteobacteria bacterium]